MDNIQFDGEHQKSFPNYNEKQPTLIRLVIKLGIADNVDTANRILIGFSIFMAVAGLLLFLSVR